MERPKLKATVREAAAENWVKKAKWGSIYLPVKKLEQPSTFLRRRGVCSGMSGLIQGSLYLAFLRS